MTAKTDPGTDRLDELLASHPGLRIHAMDGLVFEDVPLQTLADVAGTPCWVYGAQTLRARYRVLADALRPHNARVRYAVKANDHLAVLTILRQEGAGADVVSLGELARTQTAGIAAADTVFSGVGKTRAEIAAALALGIGQINVESAEELDAIEAIAQAEDRVAPVAFRINPDVDAGTHAKISTGRAGDKFGIPVAHIPDLYGRASSTPWLRPSGLALHIGSQIADMAPFRTAYRRAASLVTDLRAQGYVVPRVDCGGGLAISYGNEPAGSPAAFAGLLASVFGTLDVELLVEPGRWLVGPAGLLLAKVVVLKQAEPHPFVVLNAAMNDLLRPALYDAWHGIVPLAARHLSAPRALATVVGPVCESSDLLARKRPLPALTPGDPVAILDCGAYGAVMSSTYNARPLAAQVMTDAGEWHLIRPRMPLDQLWRHETVPPSLFSDM